jgi:nicotinate-nucleotide--dimethylbenzimidazole phosphoribosyltransferase
MTSARPAPSLGQLLDVAPLSRGIDARAQTLIDGKTKPLGALGRLEALALQVMRIQDTLAPSLRAPQLVAFAGDHGIAAEGVSAYPQEVTWQMVMNFLAGGAAINVFCRLHGIGVTVVDAGVRYVFDRDDKGSDPNGGPRLRRAKIAAGTANSVHGPAMSAAQCEAALAAGAQLVDELAAAGTNVIGCGEMGIANSAAAALLMHRLGGLPLEACVGRGTGLDDAGLERKRAVLARASARVPGVLTPLEALAQYGGFEIAQMTGAYLAAARHRMVILVDGFIASAALLVAARLAPAVLERCVFGHASAEQGHQRLLQLLGAQPLLALDMRLGEGTGAALAYPLVAAAVAFVNEMASFESAGVSEREER